MTSNFFSPFITLARKPTAILVPITLNATLTRLKNGQRKLLITTSEMVVKEIGFIRGSAIKFQALNRENRAVLILKPGNSGEGKCAEYATYLAVAAYDLPFFPKEEHKKVRLDAFYSKEDRAIITYLPDGYTPTINVEEDNDPQPVVDGWPKLKET